jgi:DnaJ-class molecular chaperone
MSSLASKTRVRVSGLETCPKCSGKGKRYYGMCATCQGRGVVVATVKAKKSSWLWGDGTGSWAVQPA